MPPKSEARNSTLAAMYAAEVDVEAEVTNRPREAEAEGQIVKAVRSVAKII